MPGGRRDSDERLVSPPRPGRRLATPHFGDRAGRSGPSPTGRLPMEPRLARRPAHRLRLGRDTEGATSATSGARLPAPRHSPPLQLAPPHRPLPQRRPSASCAPRGAASTPPRWPRQQRVAFATRRRTERSWLPPSRAADAGVWRRAAPGPADRPAGRGRFGRRARRQRCAARRLRLAAWSPTTRRSSSHTPTRPPGTTDPSQPATLPRIRR